MDELIWVGNTLYPRWLVFGVIAGVIGICVDLVRRMIKHG